MSVGGVGAAGGSAGAGAAAGGVGAAGGGSAPAGGPSGGEGVTPSSSGEASTKDISDAGDKGGNTYNINQTQNNTMFTNMSTHDSVELHNCVSKPAESNEMDLQKLIELMMIMKLLESMNENSSSGFSTTA